MTEPTATRTIEITGLGKCFYQGVNAGQKVLDALKDAGPYDERLLALYWFYVGCIAVDECQIKTSAEQDLFLRGVSCRAPNLERPKKTRTRATSARKR